MIWLAEQELAAKWALLVMVPCLLILVKDVNYVWNVIQLIRI